MSAPPSPRGNVMTLARSEAYQRRRDEENDVKENNDSDGEDDDINYDSEDDDKVAKKQADQRRQQEAHIAGYRQQMMKTTNGPPSIQHARLPTLQGPWMDMSGFNADGDDDVPLAMLQAQRRRDPILQLAGARSNPNLRATAQQQFSRPSSSHSRPGSAQGQSHSNGSHRQLPSFARTLPQDPFQDPFQNPFQDPFSLGHNRPLLQPFSGGLVGHIASEERAKASRRGSPSGSFQPIPSPTKSAFGWTNGPYQIGQMAWPYGIPGMQQPPRPQTATSMSHGLQAQSQFLQAAPWTSQHKSSQSWNHFLSQKPVENHGVAAVGTGCAVPAYGGYATSIPPTERSTIGLPSRYRPVSRAKN
ncbi:hypothetical protein B0J13DRAFT_565631 [Dactylonectria estremocensis]|uniref:Uncharacterized protein n=1 Tax=Dactylonectria estremocensis TaxID=1079267 RepID=A0A9P9DWU9_9HYPO|nr:hypothetical protein B0J13DRAFT_565631 [Dactylonectria estremocensis]